MSEVNTLSINGEEEEKPRVKLSSLFGRPFNKQLPVQALGSEDKEVDQAASFIAFHITPAITIFKRMSRGTLKRA